MSRLIVFVLVLLPIVAECLFTNQANMRSFYQSPNLRITAGNAAIDDPDDEELLSVVEMPSSVDQDYDGDELSDWLLMHPLYNRQRRAYSKLQRAESRVAPNPEGTGVHWVMGRPLLVQYANGRRR